MEPHWAYVLGLPRMMRTVRRAVPPVPCGPPDFNMVLEPSSGLGLILAGWSALRHRVVSLPKKTGYVKCQPVQAVALEGAC